MWQYCSSHATPHDLSRRHVDRRDSSSPRHYFTSLLLSNFNNGQHLLIAVSFTRSRLVKLLRSDRTSICQTARRLQNCIREIYRNRKLYDFKLGAKWPFREYRRAQFSKRSLAIKFEALPTSSFARWFFSLRRQFLLTFFFFCVVCTLPVHHGRGWSVLAHAVLRAEASVRAMCSGARRNVKYACPELRE